MKRLKKYQDEDNDFLHPFWLGILILFTVIILAGTLCLLRKKCGSNICRLFNRLRCKNELNNENHSDPSKYLPTIGSYYWPPVYVPPPSKSPKLYKLVRSIQTTTLDKDSSTQHTKSNEDSIENAIFSVTNKSDHANTSSSQLYNNRTCETARRFYASMRHTSQCQNSTSLESCNNDLSLLPANRLIKSNRNSKLNTFRPPRFFQSITDTCD